MVCIGKLYNKNAAIRIVQNDLFFISAEHSPKYTKKKLSKRIYNSEKKNVFIKILGLT